MSPGALLLVVAAALVTHWLTKGGKTKRRKRKGWSLFSRKKRSKPSWYWGNDRWRKIRKRRAEENTNRYRLSAGACRCERCTKRITGRDIHCDHIWPRKPYWFLQYFYWNTQILCGTCNIKKSNKLDGYNWRRLRQLRLHPIAWLLRKRQEARGIR